MKLVRVSGTLLLSVFCLFTPRVLAGTVWHVDAAQPAGGNGQSWASAFDSLDTAFQFAAVGDEVWVAKGRYRPTVERVPGDARSVSFTVPQGVALYGGFAGNELSLSARAGLFRQTALSGDVGVLFDPTDNARHVVTVIHPSGFPPGPTRVDGFTITGGNGAFQGGGLYCFNSGLTVANCIFRDNSADHGGALLAQAGIVRVKWCEFVDNFAHVNGGAIWGRALTYRIYNSVFRGNGSGERGGAIYIGTVFAPRNVLVANCVFADNWSTRGGAGFLSGGDFGAGQAKWQNCTFAYNSAMISGGGVFAKTGTAFPAKALLYNCVLWDNSAVFESQVWGRVQLTHSNVAGRCCGPGNISSDPLFVDAGARDLRLLPGSPCIDAGANGRVADDHVDVDDDGVFSAEQTELDAGHMPRFIDDPLTMDSGSGTAPVVDMGAFEFAP